MIGFGLFIAFYGLSLLLFLYSNTNLWALPLIAVGACLVAMGIWKAIDCGDLRRLRQRLRLCLSIAVGCCVTVFIPDPFRIAVALGWGLLAAAAFIGAGVLLTDLAMRKYGIRRW